MARYSADWIHDGIIYEINTRVFSPTGDFAGVLERLDDLQQLGVTILWLMPIHPCGRERAKGTLGSPYAVRDYFAIAPEFGTNEQFHQLVRETHRRGMKIIIDIVANHTAWDSVMMAHPEYYKQNASGQVIAPNPGWIDVAGLNYTNAALRQYMIGMLEYWLREFDLDGFRCDVAGLVPTDWWNEARDAIDKVKPDIFLLAEWHSPDLLEHAFDADYSWPLHKAINDVLMRGLSAAALRQEWEEERRLYPPNALHMRFSDNHDEKRAIARFGERGALAASAFMFLLDGIPLIYNGMEVGDTAESGDPALFERLPIFWGIAQRRPEFPRFYREIVPLRSEHEALRRGALEWLDNSDPQRIMTFLRSAGKETLLVAVNFSNQPWKGTVTTTGVIDREIALTGFNDEHKGAALPDMRLDAWGVRIFRLQH